jgi:hypothetical protein
MGTAAAATPTAEAVDARAGLAEAAVEMFLELGEAVVHVVEAVGVMRSERVYGAIELPEEVEGAVALGLGEGGMGGGVRVKRKEGVETRVEASRSTDAAEKEVAEMGGLFGAVEVGFRESGEGVGLGVAKGVFHAYWVWVKHLLWGGGGGVNFGPHLFEGVCLESAGVFPTEVDDGGERGSSARRILCGCGPTKGNIYPKIKASSAVSKSLKENQNQRRLSSLP